MTQPGIRITVVDDEPVIAWTLAAILRSKGFVADCFTNPLNALESAQDNPPDLLLSDVVMPELSGVDLALRFRSLYPTCKVLLFSGQANTVDFPLDTKARIHSFQVLSKPIHPTDLLLAIRDQGLVQRVA